MEEPEIKRAVAFFDGQNLYHHAKAAFGHHHPNYDPVKLCDAVCAAHGWVNHGVRFYTGVPSAERQPEWGRYWSNRLLSMRRAGIAVTDRPLRYDRDPAEPDKGVEKGIDVRIALDVIRLAYSGQYDVALIFSQDQDLAEVADDIREIARSTGRWIKAACAFPAGPAATSSRGLAKTDWFRMDRVFYDRCLDHTDYR